MTDLGGDLIHAAVTIVLSGKNAAPDLAQSAEAFLKDQFDNYDAGEGDEQGDDPASP